VEQSCAQFVQTEITPPSASSSETPTSGSVALSLLDERVGVRAFIDIDGDSISDYDEVNLYHTNPNINDTDKDGMSDGEEILARTDPSMTNIDGGISPSGTTPGVAIETSLTFAADPRESGVVAPAILKVENVVPLPPRENTGTSTKILVLTGRTLPNSFVTLYIFSTPIVVVVKADDTGAWTYTLDKELPDGAHEVYSAITDSSGKVIAKSEPLPFVKEAQALTIGANGAPVEASEVAPSFFSGMPVYASLLMLVGILGIALTIIGLIVRRRGDAESPLGTP
jgi:hypothetical protein